MNSPPSNSSLAFNGPAPNGAAMPNDHDEVLWQTLELEMAREQLKVLQESIAQGRERIELLNSELRMLPWNHARVIRDARLSLGCSRSALTEARRAVEEARSRLQQATDELTLAEEQQAAARSERRARGLGLLMGRRRRHDRSLLDLRMNQALASQQLQAATERLQQDQIAVEAQERALSDLLARRRRQRSILLGEIESLQRCLQHEQLQCRYYAQIVAEFEAKADTVHEDSLAPA